MLYIVIYSCISVLELHRYIYKYTPGLDFCLLSYVNITTCLPAFFVLWNNCLHKSLDILGIVVAIVIHCIYMFLCNQCTARTARFSKKSPWSVFFRGEMSVICHKITVKCRWNHGETFTAKINKLRPKCRWNILIAGDNTAAKIIRVYTYM
jgi:hypothetical protein